jgi:hypothetical protein
MCEGLGVVFVEQLRSLKNNEAAQVGRMRQKAL